MTPKPFTINNSPLAKLRVALVHDEFIQDGGAEKVFLAIAELFPQAPIYTALATTDWLEKLGEREVQTSFMQKLPLKRQLYRAYFPLHPLAIESFDFSDYDLVISHTTRFAFGVITKPETTHISYVHNPGRMFWEASDYFGKGSWLKFLLSPVLSYFRLWSYTAAQRVDYFIANSKNIAAKVKRYFGRDPTVVYPFVDLERFSLTNDSRLTTNNYYLVVTRLARWKRVDLAIKAAKQLGVKLKIVGEGPDQRRLKRLGGSGVEFIGRVSTPELADLYQKCITLIMTQEEDFGITALEAQAAGRPVVAYKAGGALETVIAGKTGEFFEHQSPESLVEALKRFRPERYDLKDCQDNAALFSKEKFQMHFLKEVVALLK